MPVRIAGTGDSEAVRGLVGHVKAAFGEPAAVADGLDPVLASALAGGGPLEFLVAEDDDGCAVGLVSVALCPTTLGGGAFAWIDDLFVMPPRRRAGIASELLRAAVERGHARGAAEIRLSADMGDAGLIRLHRRAGFVPRGQALLVHDPARRNDP